MQKWEYCIITGPGADSPGQIAAANSRCFHLTSQGMMLVADYNLRPRGVAATDKEPLTWNTTTLPR